MLQRTSPPSVEPEAVPHAGMRFGEFVTIIAATMAINALAIDAMLPALPDIGAALGVSDENQAQLVITAYLLGFGFAQIFYGPLSDRFGRRPVLLGGLAIFVLSSVAATLAGSLDQMMVARAVQGIGAASTRVIAVSIVRDCYSGRRMARVMSLVFIVFIAVPVVAPSLGQGVVLFAPWPWIFVLLAAFALALCAWVGLRLPETLAREDRRAIRASTILEGFRVVLTTRMSIGYTIASTMILGGLFGFINSAQQIFVDVLGLGAMFPLVFAGIAIFIAASSYLNSRIVERLGMRKVSHTAVLGFTAVAALHALVAWLGYESLYTFVPLQAATMFFFGLTMGNFGAMAMEPVGHIAGTASSVQGFITTLGGALLGFWIGQHYDGTAVPLTLGFTVLGLLAVLAVLITERGRLFQATTSPPTRS